MHSVELPDLLLPLVSMGGINSNFTLSTVIPTPIPFPGCMSTGRPGQSTSRPGAPRAPGGAGECRGAGGNRRSVDYDRSGDV